MDAGADAGGPDRPIGVGGCGCRAAGSSPRAPLALLALAALVALRRRGR
ncbi:MAG: MYXO-CTERM sorting domain-containing protein [Sandaracinaceae bacterium]|nr:MYXO-CTERM sorting domain-containing protein [Sandaracinaceae bacterium]